MEIPINHDYGKPIDRGATAEIYAWDPDCILKLFFTGYRKDAVEYEAKIARAVYDCGLPVPGVGEVVETLGRYGLIYQRIDGIPMTKMFLLRPWRINYFARRMAELHAEMHSASFTTKLPDQQDRLKEKIANARELTDKLRLKALAVLDQMPQGDRLCHGDFHPGNILVCGKRESIIDWVDATLGNPLADVARTMIILRGSAESNRTKNPLERAFVRRLLALYLRHYFHLRPGGEKMALSLVPVIAAARLSEKNLAVEDWLREQAEHLP